MRLRLCPNREQLERAVFGSSKLKGGRKPSADS